MAKTKKPKKKYVPRQIRYPSLVTQMNSFGPFEKALDELLETGTATVDESGLLVFKDGAGQNQSFVSTLKIYIDIITIYCARNNIQYDIKPLTILQNRMFEALGFDEEEIDEARKCLALCKEIIVKIKPTTLLDILDTVRIGLNFETATTISLKDPQMAIFSFKYKAGDLSYDDVLERNKKFQNLAIEYPDNEHYCKLRDFYMEFLAAYNFLNQKKLSEL